MLSMCGRDVCRGRGGSCYCTSVLCQKAQTEIVKLITVHSASGAVGVKSCKALLIVQLLRLTVAVATQHKNVQFTKI